VENLCLWVNIRMRGSYKARKRYYNEAALGARKATALPQIIVKLHKTFKRFELSSYQVAENLLSPSQRLLDIGCGEGNFLEFISSKSGRRKFDEYWSVDISPLALRKCEARISNRPDKQQFLRWLNG